MKTILVLLLIHTLFSLRICLIAYKYKPKGIKRFNEKDFRTTVLLLFLIPFLGVFLNIAEIFFFIKDKYNET